MTDIPKWDSEDLLVAYRQVKAERDRVRGYLDTALRKIESGTVTEHDREWSSLVRQRLALPDGRIRDPEWAEKIIAGPQAPKERG